MMSIKSRALLAAATVAAAVGFGATQAQAVVYCNATQSNDGHTLYPATCYTSAPGTRWQMVVTTCGTSSCRTVSTPIYNQGTTQRFYTSGWITNVKFVLS
jgi:hypothetical protein